MSRQQVLAEIVPPYAERKRQIEASPLPANLGQLLDEAAGAAPDQVVLDFFESDEQLTYAALRDQVNRLANGMLAAGIGKGVHVGVMIPNIAAFPVTWLALARIGAVMIPINIAYTPRELTYVLQTGDGTHLVVHDSCLGTVASAAGAAAEGSGSPALSPDRIFVVGAQPPGHRSWAALMEGQSGAHVDAPPVGHQDLLNIQFTSGTTGFPKGAMLTQLYWLTIGKQAAYRDGREIRRVLAATPFFYMDPQWQFLLCIYRRGTLYVARRQSGSRYMEWVRQHRIQFGLCPEIVIKQPPSPHDRETEVIRFNVYGLSKGLHQALEERFDVIARESFGMTEIGTGLFMPIEATDMVGSGSCGMPAPFREARIVDADGAVVGPGVIGELQVRGQGILKGYYNNPDATKAAFDGDWFRTGDLFRRDDAGYFYIVGRIKDMIRRAGENISAREVETVVVAMPEVSEAAAVPVKDPVRGEEIKIYIVPREGQEKSQHLIDRIIAHCTANLAAFKVPRFYVFRDSLPKTASGKISKPGLVADQADLRAGSYDRVERKQL